MSKLALLISITLPLGAVTYTANCPSGTSVGQTIICNFSLSPPAFFLGSDTVTVTPSDGVTLAPSPTGNTIYPSIGQTLYNFAFTPSSKGVKTLTFTNGQGWTDPGPVSITVTASATSHTFPPSLTPGFVQAVPWPSGGTSTSFTIPISPAAGNTVIVGVDLYNADGPPYAGPTVVDNLGNQFTQDGMIRYHYTSIYELHAIYRLKVGRGVTGITVTRSNPSYSTAIAAEFTHLADNPVDTVDTAGNDVHDGCCWITGPMVTSNDKDLIIGWAAQADDGAHPPGGGISPWQLAANVNETCCQANGVDSGTMVYRVTSSPGYYLPTGRGHYALAMGIAYKAAPAHAGQSLVLTPGNYTASVAVPSLNQDQPWRVEFQMHDWETPAIQTNIWEMNDIGASTELLTNGTTLRINDKLDSTAPSVCDLDLTGLTNALVRVQRDPVAQTLTGEVWNWDSTQYNTCMVSLTSFGSWPSVGGGKFGDAQTTVDLGFYKVFDTLVPLGSRPPVTATRATCPTVCTNFTFNGTLTDSSGNGHDATWSGTAFYTDTPNQGPVSLPKTYDAPFWSQQVSFRAGTPGQLDCANSYSLAESSSDVSCFWQLLSGPSMPVWSSRTAAQPILNGLTFGDYKFQLQVTDATNATALSTLDVGAVATDRNGVVVQANPQATQLFGDMIAFGKNPWQYQDYVNLSAGKLRSSAYASMTPPSWVTRLAGTISYWPFYAGTTRQTTLSADITSSTTTLALTDATKIDLSTLPAIIQVGPINGTIEEMEICAAASNTLTLCYNGRGWRQGTWGEVTAPQAWAAGTTVTQIKTAGTGTQFLKDFCPAGIGEAGQILYSTGTVAVTAGSTSLTGAGTSWTNDMTSERLRIAGTHGGVSFTFFATISSVNGATSITLSRPWPADADSPLAGLSYSILWQGRNLSAGWLRSDSTTGQQNMSISACLSDTAMYQSSGNSIANYNTAYQSGQRYAYSDTSWESEMGPNYYDEVLANYASYLRSGLNLFLNNARAIGDYWSSMPELDQGYALGTPRHQGVTGLIAGAVLDGRTNNWYAIRNIAKVAVASSFSVGAILSPCSSDTREQAYGQSWLALLAMFDPDSAQKAYWQSQLPAAYARDNGCITGGVFQQPFYDGLSGAFTFSGKTATSTSIPASLCPTVASGSIGPLSPGNTTASGTGFIPQPSGKIVIKTTRNGSPYLFYSLFTYNSTTSITLATPFDGDAGTYSYQIESDQKFLSFSAALTDYANLNNFYSCTWVNGTTITLDRAWAGGSGTFNATRQPSTYVGYGWTPYQNGIKALATHYASLGATGTTAANYAQLANSVATSILTSGFDPVTKGLYYARNFYNCEPPGIYKIGCSYGPDSYSQQAARTLSGEAQNAMSMAYQANQTPAAKTFGDQFYGAQWGAPGFGNPPYSDGIYIQPATWNYKWYGFLFGIGMSHQWPAVRLGGVSPTQMRTVNIPFVLSMVANAAKVQITLTQPTGAISSPIVCTTSPCALTVDARVGSPLMKLDYLNSSGAVIAPGDPIPLYLLN